MTTQERRERAQTTANAPLEKEERGKVSKNENTLALGLVCALHEIRHLLRELDVDRWRQEALEQVLASLSPLPGKLPQAIADAEAKVIRDALASGHNSDDKIRELDQLAGQIQSQFSR
jgi:hypothetical protein